MSPTRIVSRLFPALCAAAAVAALSAAPASAAVDGPFEPNDTLQTAFGPLTPDVGYTAQFESASNPDWYYVYTAGAGTVDVALSLASCSAAGAGPTCSNVTARVYNGDGGLVGSAIVNTTATPTHITFDAPRRWRYSISLQQAGAGGATYTLTTGSTGGLTSAAPDQPLPAAPTAPAVDLPSVIPRFSARFETSYVGTARKPRSRKITGLTVLGVQKGSTIVVRCTTGCARRFRKTVTAQGASRRLGGLPMALRTNTRFRIEVRRTGFVGRFREYDFARKVPLPRVLASGCTSPYDFSPIFCAPGTE
jgi:phosphotransferase system HPr-like phosphotransfer protein